MKKIDEKKPKKPKRPRLPGRHLMSLGALALMGLCGFELWIRLDDFKAWTAGVRHLSAVRGTPFWQDMAIIFEAPEMQLLAARLIFLLAAMIFALVCLIRRNRAKGAWILALLCLMMAGAWICLDLYAVSPDLKHFAPDLDLLAPGIEMLELAPAGLMFVGLAANGTQGVIARRKAAREAARTGKT